jgi:hypothetical protein
MSAAIVIHHHPHPPLPSLSTAAVVVCRHCCPLLLLSAIAMVISRCSHHHHSTVSAISCHLLSFLLTLSVVIFIHNCRQPPSPLFSAAAIFCSRSHHDCSAVSEFSTAIIIRHCHHPLLRCCLLC